jgi:hypothetical protein
VIEAGALFLSDTQTCEAMDMKAAGEDTLAVIRTSL